MWSNPPTATASFRALTANFGRPKAEVMAERFREINPAIEVIPLVEFIRDEKIDRLLETRFDYAWMRSTSFPRRCFSFSAAGSGKFR